MVNKTMLNEIKNLEACKRNMYMKFKQILFLREKYCKKFAIGRKNNCLRSDLLNYFINFQKIRI